MFCKDNANECKENLFSICRVQLILCKGTTKTRDNMLIRQKQFFFRRNKGKFLYLMFGGMRKFLYICPQKNYKI